MQQILSFNRNMMNLAFYKKIIVQAFWSNCENCSYLNNFLIENFHYCFRRVWLRESACEHVGCESNGWLCFLKLSAMGYHGRRLGSLTVSLCFCKGMNIWENLAHYPFQLSFRRKPFRFNFRALRNYLCCCFFNLFWEKSPEIQAKRKRAYFANYFLLNYLTWWNSGLFARWQMFKCVYAVRVEQCMGTHLYYISEKQTCGFTGYYSR